ncbi:ATP synthase subunit I [Thermomonas sp.]|uniref:ATP synthase subunit I n=1 Tax=Thermomonas sp. TaxID=1971895 RepID=UPI0026228CF1|nr:ATP synthase subunit I [Thermomonas sp.]
MSTDTKKVALAQHTVTQAAKACPEEDGDEVFRPLTAEEARQWRERQPQLPVTRALVWEGLTGLLVAVLAWLFTRRADVAWSAAYGSLAGALPAALAALGTARWARPGFPPAAALAGLLLWEGVKLVLTMGLLMAAPRFLGVPSWPALLIGLALTIKMYWVGLLWAGPVKSRQGRVQKEHTDGC